MTFIRDHAAENVELWERHVGPALGRHALNQFIRATKDPSNLLVRRAISPNVFTGSSRTDDFYYPIAYSTYTRGRNHHLAKLLSMRTGQSEDNDAEWAGATYFANALRPTMPYMDPLGGEEEWEAPKDRVCFAPRHIFTFEFDRKEIAFLGEQLSWLRSSKKKLKCPMGNLYRALSCYVDFVGITVCYGGNKSLHTHIVFDTMLAQDRLSLSGIVNPRDGFIAHWNRLSSVVLEALKPSYDQLPDASLRFPEAYRRLPNGHRVAEEKNLLGIPAGTYVPQVVLWEEWRQRAAADTDLLFFEPEAFTVSAVKSKRSQAKGVAASLSGDLSPEDFAYCEERLKEMFPGYPRFASLNYEGGHWVARFFNHPNDQNPSSVMRDDYSTILLAGAKSQGLTATPLTYPLGVMMKLWLRQRERNLVFDANIKIDEIILEVAGAPPTDHLEQVFQQTVTNSVSARAAMRDFLPQAVRQHPHVVVRGPEGVGKSSGLFAIHDVLVEWLREQDGGDAALYAFGDYASAEEKCIAFNAVQERNGFVGIVLPSFTESYQRACSALGLDPMTNTEAARMGFDSHWMAIKAMQPAVLAAFQKDHAATWHRIGQAIPVFFTVHQIAHGWAAASRTRLMWSRCFWDGDEQDAAHRQRCLRASMLGLAVHDELKVDSLVEMWPSEIITWVTAMCEQFSDEWKGKWVSIASRYETFAQFRQKPGLPIIDGKPREIIFEDARKIADMVAAGYKTVITANSREYVVDEDVGDDETADRPDIYAERYGREWAISPKSWWHNLAHRVIALTTEMLPTRVAEQSDSAWRVFQLDTPGVEQDAVDVFAVRGVTSRNLAKLCTRWRQRLGSSLFVVSNRVKGLQDSMTHAAAKGSNKLIGLDVLQTMTFMAPDEYEKLQALNAWMNRNDACLLRHVDEFNQTAGRNLGFRKQGSPKHYLLISPSLFAKLNEKALVNCRYDLRVHVTSNQRVHIRAVRAAEPPTSQVAYKVL